LLFFKKLKEIKKVNRPCTYYIQ